MHIILGLLTLSAGIGVCILAGTLLVGWLAICFGTVILGLILLFFAPTILFLPAGLFMPGLALVATGVAMISSNDSPRADRNFSANMKRNQERSKLLKEVIDMEEPVPKNPPK